MGNLNVTGRKLTTKRENRNQRSDSHQELSYKWDDCPPPPRNGEWAPSYSVLAHKRMTSGEALTNAAFSSGLWSQRYRRVPQESHKELTTRALPWHRLTAPTPKAWSVDSGFHPFHQHVCRWVGTGGRRYKLALSWRKRQKKEKKNARGFEDACPNV